MNQIPVGRLEYFRERFRSRLYSVVVEEFIRQRDAKNLTKEELAERIGRHPDAIDRFLGSTDNLTLNMVSDLLLARGCELKLEITPLALSWRE